MRGQVSLEFMLVFLLEMAALSIICASLMALDGQAESKADDLQGIMEAESAARAVEAYLYSGMDMRMGFDGISYRIENGSFHMWHGDGMIEIRGVFDGDEAEPM